MESIKKIFKIGPGPSSSHTIGPSIALKKFLNKNFEIIKNDKRKIDKIIISLYHSLALTGKGHFTDKVLEEIIKKCVNSETNNKFTKNFNLQIDWKYDERLPYHPNGLKIKSIDQNGNIILQNIFYSIGGGDIVEEIDGKIIKEDSKEIYYYKKMEDILNYLKKSGKTFWEYVEEIEGKEIWDFLEEIWANMIKSIKNGLKSEGVLPGDPCLPRKASIYYTKSLGYKGTLKKRTQIFSFALAVAEENASGNIVVTAPTCGSAGVLPAVLYHIMTEYNIDNKKILKALATAGLIGNLVKNNGSISGAEVGCQGEIGTACSMASAAATQIFGGTPSQIEYAAEMGLEHHLGLTCDPVGGYVQIPCIERNAFAATRALDISIFSILSDGSHRISFDKIVEVMKKTGHDLPHIYKETSLGGLASIELE
ncbi:MAG: L-serine ammonia-lyase [Spirochaetes bacterium]|nr:L-serine ammonia-lyase [Spirochaetota bacterium]